MPVFKDTTAIVTGGTSGIGQEVALALARDGANVVVVGRNQARIDATLETLRTLHAPHAPHDALGLSLDVSREEDMQAMADRTLEQFGRIDILIHCAASAGERGMPYTVAQMPVEDWDAGIAINLKGVFFSNRAVLPAMIAQRSGDIINVSSARGGVRGLPCAAAYAAAKHGVMGLTASLAEEVRRHGVRVQVVLPDVTETPLMQVVGDLAPQGMLKPRTVGEFIVDMIRQPRDSHLIEPWICPFATT
ncbi:MAG: SDR family oxidoreductase [bacterium]